MGKENTNISKESWYSLSADEVIQKLRADIHSGFSSEEVNKRRDDFGLKQLTPKKRVPLWRP